MQPLALSETGVLDKHQAIFDATLDGSDELARTLEGSEHALKLEQA
jgi:hypothetical protein